MKSFIILAGLLASSVCGHMQMSNPYPIRSPLNKNASGEKDYSYTTPLSTSGSDYPCKGYADDEFVSVADYSAGQTYEMTLAGSATHGGGSCQISLSYDKGKTFKVIHSMLGGCPLTDTYNFKIPSDAPSGQALLAWSWFNKIGNREMYMNCAQVTIKGASTKREHPRDISSKLAPRSSFDSLPPMFIANVNGPGQCTTTETEEVNFPLPGDSTEGSLSGKGYTCKSTADFLGSGSSSSSGTASNSSSSSSASVSNGAVSSATSSSNSSKATPTSSSKKASSFGSQPTSARASPTSAAVASSAATALPTSPAASESQRAGSGSSADSAWGNLAAGSIVCGSDGKSWSMVANGAPVNMGSVAGGMECRNGAMVPA